MTSAEAVRELRQLIVQAAHGGMSHDELLYMLQTVREIAMDGIDPVVELRIRRFRRRVELFSAPH